MAEYDVGPVGLTIPLPQEAPLPEPPPEPVDQQPPSAEQAPLPAYEGTVIDETA